MWSNVLSPFKRLSDNHHNRHPSPPITPCVMVYPCSYSSTNPTSKPLIQTQMPHPSTRLWAFVFVFRALYWLRDLWDDYERTNLVSRTGCDCVCDWLEVAIFAFPSFYFSLSPFLSIFLSPLLFPLSRSLRASVLVPLFSLRPSGNFEYRPIGQRSIIGAFLGGPCDRPTLGGTRVRALLVLELFSSVRRRRMRRVQQWMAYVLFCFDGGDVK